MDYKPEDENKHCYTGRTDRQTEKFIKKGKTRKRPKNTTARTLLPTKSE